MRSISTSHGREEWQIAQAARLRATRVLWLARQQVVADQRSQVLEKEQKLLRDAVEAGEATSLELAAVEKASSVAFQEASAFRGQQATERLAMYRAIGFTPTASVSLQAPAHRYPGQSLRSKSFCPVWKIARLDLVALPGSAMRVKKPGSARPFRPNFRLDVGLTGGRDSDRLVTAGFEIRVALPMFERNQGSYCRGVRHPQTAFRRVRGPPFRRPLGCRRIPKSVGPLPRSRLRTLDAVLPLLQRQSAVCQGSEKQGEETRTRCLSVIEAALDAEGQLLAQQRMQAELAISMDLVGPDLGTHKLLSGSFREDEGSVPGTRRQTRWCSFDRLGGLLQSRRSAVGPRSATPLWWFAAVGMLLAPSAWAGSGTAIARATMVAIPLQAYARVESVGVVPVKAGQPGFVAGLKTVPGEKVEAGAIVGRLVGPPVDASLAGRSSEIASAEGEVEAARKTLDLERQKLSKHLSMLKEVYQAEAVLTSAQARLGNARAQLAALETSLVLRAPAEGRVLTTEAASGELVAAGQTIVTLQPSSGLWLVAGFSECRRRGRTGMAGL